MEELFHPQQLIGLFFFELEERDPRHLGDDVRDIFFSDHGLVLFLILLPFPFGLIQ